MKEINNPPQDLSNNRVLHEFTKRLSITPMQIIKHSKCAQISELRHLYCKLRYDKHRVSYSAVGREIARAHSTVKYSVTRINNLLYFKDKRIVELWNKVKNITE